MPDRPEIDLEALLAADEAAIRDEGFSARLAAEAARMPARPRASGVRRFVVYGAGITGFGFAVGGLVEMSPYLPKMTGVWEKTRALASTANADLSAGLSGQLAGGGMPMLAMVAVAAGLVFSVLAMASQAR